MIPTALHAVAMLQLLSGLATLAGVIAQLTEGTLNLNLMVLGIPAYFGLMRLSPGWRTWTLAITWTGLLVSPIAFLWGLGFHPPAEFEVFGIPGTTTSSPWLSVAAVPGFLFGLWQYRVLTRPDVAALFEQPATVTA